MERLAAQLNHQVCYFTENPPNDVDEYHGYKYFVCFQNTHKVICAWKTQTEAVDGLKDLLETRLVWDGVVGFLIAKES